MPDLDPWYLENLVCPVERTALVWENGELRSAGGRRYPVVNGIPVMLVEERDQTLGVAHASIRCAREAMARGGAGDALHLQSLGISDAQKADLAGMIAAGASRIDPVVSFMVGATNGIAYSSLVGSLDHYPIPEMRLPHASGDKLLLDVGCNWGRWCVAAARLGYSPVGIDPSLGAVLAAGRMARDLGVTARFIVGDARFLPVQEQVFDCVFSYSVLQHFSKPDCRQALNEMGRVLKPGGNSLVQMAHAVGVRSFQHQLRRGFREPQGFEVRYWALGEMMKAFSDSIGPATASVDCYFGLGLQKSDAAFLRTLPRFAVYGSEMLRSLSNVVRPLVKVADSIFIAAKKERKGPAPSSAVAAIAP